MYDHGYWYIITCGEEGRCVSMGTGTLSHVGRRGDV